MPNDWAIGDLVHEKHQEHRMGIIIDIISLGNDHTTKVAVQWTEPNPNQWRPGRPEIIDTFYLIKVQAADEV